MRHETWMQRDERTPAERLCQQLSNLRQTEAALERQLTEVRKRIEALTPSTATQQPVED